MLASYVMSQPSGAENPDDDMVLMFLDISRAHPHIDMKRELYTELPAEHPEALDPTKVGRLKKCLYGVRDAGQNFEMRVCEVSEEAGSTRGMHNPCVFNNVERAVSYLHHGGDFILGGRRSQCQWIADQIGKVFIVKNRGCLGPRHYDKKSMVILHRELRWIDQGEPGGERIEYEADPRHREVLLLQLGRNDQSRGVVTPFEKVALTPDRLEPSRGCHVPERDHEA